MAYSAAQVNTIFQSVLQRPADLAAVQAFAGSSASDQQIRTQIETSNEASVNVNPVVRLYQGAFGRLPDTSGLQANVTNYINGYNINSLATSFLSGPEAAAIFGSANPTVSVGFVQTIYQNALNRTGSSSELSYWVGTGKSAGQILAEISNSQEAVNKEAVPVVSFLDAQATGALNGTGTSVTGSLYNQTTTNFTFTSGADAIVGSVNADTFNQAGTVAGTTTTTVLAANVNANDTINAGSGVDTLTIDQTAGAFNTASVPTTINGLEVINLVGAQNNTLDLSTANGLQLFTLRNASGNGTDAITLKAGVLFGLDNVVNTGAETVTFTGTTTFGSVAVANGTNVGTVNLNNTGITTLNVVSTGSSGVTTGNTIGTLASTGTETTINVSGDRALTIGAIDTSVTTFNASANSAGVTVTLGAQDIAVTGGSGNDKFIFGTTLTTADTVVGGTGTDTITVATTDITTGATLNALNSKVSGVEVLELNGATSAVQTGSGSGSLTNTELTKILFSTSGNDVITQADSAHTFAFGTGNTGGTDTFTLASGNTTLNLSVEGANAASGGTATAASTGAITVNLATGTAAGTVETINLTSTATGTGSVLAANTADSINAVAGSTVKVLGGNDLTIGGSTNKITIDASSFTGKLTVTGSTAGDTFTLGSAADTVNETFTAAVAGVGGAAGTPASASSTYANLDTINSFTKSDTLTLSNVTFGASGTGLTKYDASSAVSFEQALTSAEGASSSTTAAYFNFGGNTYVVSNTDSTNTATANGSTDLVIKITGVQTLTADAAGIHGA